MLVNGSLSHLFRASGGGIKEGDPLSPSSGSRGIGRITQKGEESWLEWLPFCSIWQEVRKS